MEAFDRLEYNMGVGYVVKVATLVWSARVGASDQPQFGSVQPGGHWHVLL